MSIVSTIRAYNQLSPLQKEFVKTGQYSASLSAHKWIRFLEPVCRFDKLCDGIRKRVGGLLIIMGILSFLSVFVTVMLETAIPFLLCFVPLICFLPIYWLLSRKDVNDNLRNTVYPLLNVLALEVGNRAKIDLKLNFNKPLEAKYLVRTLKIDKRTKFYRFDIIRIQCLFPDGTKLNWLVRDTIRRRTQRSQSGKTKVKLKLKRRVMVQLAFKKSVYGLDDSIHKSGLKTGKIKETDNKITYKAVFKQSEMGKVAAIDVAKLIDTTRAPYALLTQGNLAA